MYPSTVSFDAFTEDTFSARRLPDRVHYRMVRCNTCGLVRSDPVADAELHANLYRGGGFGAADETDNMAQTYGRYLARLDGYDAVKGQLLEVGCATGFMLEQALAQGYAQVSGVEPSEVMVAAASPAVAPHIVCDIMRPDLFPPEIFDVVCMFQTFDHLAEPVAMLNECRRVLRPGGLILLLNHNVAAPFARLLGERSPIIDLQHTYLYNKDTIRRVLDQCGFTTLETGDVRNDYTLRYLGHLAPLPGLLKTVSNAILAATPLGKLPLSLPLGNLYAIARKPGAE